MARKKAGKRGAAIIVLVVLAVLAGGPSAASASLAKSYGPVLGTDVPAWSYEPAPDASWVEE